MKSRMNFVYLVLGGQLSMLLALAVTDTLTLPRYTILAGLVFIGAVYANPTNIRGEAYRNMRLLAVAVSALVLLALGYLILQSPVISEITAT